MRPVLILRTILVWLQDVLAYRAVPTASRATSGKPRFRAIALLSLFLSAIPASSAIARDSKQAAGGYIRTDFTVENGLPDNVVNAFVQTRNGLLWIGTESGLASFDGRHFTRTDLRGLASTARGAVHALAEAPNGDLWVGTDAGLVRIASESLEHFESPRLTLYHLGSDKTDEIRCLHVSRDGVLWVGTDQGLFRLELGKFVQVIPLFSVFRIAEALDGHLLLVTERRFLEWNGHDIVEHPGLAARLRVPEDGIFDVLQDRTGAMWFCTVAGVARRMGDSFHLFKPYGVPQVGGAFRVYQDPRGNVWVNMKMGLYRATANHLELLPPGVHARSIYADQDGNLWVGTNGAGLVRFKDRVVRVFRTADGLPNNITMTVISSHDGRLWVGNNCGGLSVFDGRRFKTYNEKDGLSNSCVWALAEDRNNDLWVGTWLGGLYRFKGGRFTQYSKPQGLVSNIVLRIVAARDGSLWIATPDGISHMQNGRFRNYTTADGLSSNHVDSVYQDPSGDIWAASRGVIDRLVGDRFVPFASADEDTGRFCIRLAEDSSGDFYAALAPKGIGLIEGNRLITIDEDLEVLDMVESPQKDLWFSGRNGIIRVAAANLKRSLYDREAPLDYASFGRADGLDSTECSVGAPDIAISPDGKLWVATVKGLAMVDIARLPRVNRKPKIFVEAVTIERKTDFAGRKLTLRPGTHHVELHLDGMDLASPEKIRLQYRMDDVDSVWLDADPTRTAIYTNIPVGTHAFHVRASGSDGVWDRVGIVYNVTQQPYFYQTIWFRLVSVTAVIFLLAGAYFLRVRQIVREIHGRLEERLSERERIARELHDTLLQSFHGLMLRFQAATNLLPDRPEEAKRNFESAIDQAAQAIREGRDAVQGLRSSTVVNNDLALAINTLGEELAAGESNQNAAVFQVAVEGTPQNLHPILRDEVYRIAGEALRNAFKHAQAQRIEVEIRYDERQFRLRVRDDGKGIDAKLVNQNERPGHYGLRGMRERAKLLGGKLAIWSELDSGTELELSIPASYAYEASAARRRSWFAEKFSGKDTERKS